VTDRVNTYTKFNFWVPKNSQVIALRQFEREFSMALMNLASITLKNHQNIAKIKKPWLESIFFMASASWNFQDPKCRLFL